ncbi:MAG: hydrogenase maturation protease [Chloroflexi bacterium]|nr:hydrogenase maturation protease [Chloroflexota bacterium]
MKTLVLGLGNPILTDDGVGFQVVRDLKPRIERDDVKVEESSLGGLSLLDLITGFDKVILVDAIQTVGGEPGKIYRLEPGDFDATMHAASPHDVNFATALEFGRKVDLPMPSEIVILAIEVEDVTTFSEECTPKVMAAVPECVAMILREVDGSPSH